MPIPPGVSQCSIEAGNVSVCAKPGYMVEVRRYLLRHNILD